MIEKVRPIAKEGTLAAVSFFRRPFICPPYALHFPQRGKMRKILASIVIALLLTSCLLQFDPDYIP